MSCSLPSPACFGQDRTSQDRVLAAAEDKIALLERQVDRQQQDLLTQEARACQRVVGLEKKIESLSLSLATKREEALQSVGEHHTASAKHILEKERLSTRKAREELEAEQRLTARLEEELLESREQVNSMQLSIIPICGRLNMSTILLNAHIIISEYHSIWPLNCHILTPSLPRRSSFSSTPTRKGKPSPSTSVRRRSHWS